MSVYTDTRCYTLLTLVYIIQDDRNEKKIAVSFLNRESMDHKLCGDKRKISLVRRQKPGLLYCNLSFGFLLLILEYHLYHSLLRYLHILLVYI